MRDQQLNRELLLLFLVPDKNTENVNGKKVFLLICKTLVWMKIETVGPLWMCGCIWSKICVYLYGAREMCLCVLNRFVEVLRIHT